VPFHSIGHPIGLSSDARGGRLISQKWSGKTLSDRPRTSEIRVRCPTHQSINLSSTGYPAMFTRLRSHTWIDGKGNLVFSFKIAAKKWVPLLETRVLQH